jgi:hypothetical protein
MKREAMDHPKLYVLADQITLRGAPLEWALVIATGVFERLLLFAGQYAPDGRVGKFPLRQLVRAIGWPADEDALVNSLVESRLLDHTEQGLVVHDWPQHADRHVHRKLVRANQRFADGTVPTLSYATEKEREAWKGGDTAGLPGEPTAGVDSQSQSQSQSQSLSQSQSRSMSVRQGERVQMPAASRRLRPRSTSTSISLEATPEGQHGTDVHPKQEEQTFEQFETFWDKYPRRAGENGKARARRAWERQLRQGATADEMIAGAERYAAFVRANRDENTKFVKMASTFLGPDSHFREPWVIEKDAGKLPARGPSAEPPGDVDWELQARLAEEHNRRLDTRNGATRVEEAGR